LTANTATIKKYISSTLVPAGSGLPSAGTAPTFSVNFF